VALLLEKQRIHALSVFVVDDFEIDDVSLQWVFDIRKYDLAAFFYKVLLVASIPFHPARVRGRDRKESQLEKSVISKSRLNASLFNSIGYSDVGLSDIGISNVG